MQAKASNPRVLSSQYIPDSSFSAYGVFVEEIAVCQGYALAYKLLCDRVGIECYMVTSDSMNHAWNIVWLDGSWYHVDATWDDPSWDMPGRVDHTYLFRSDDDFRNRLEHYGWQVTMGSAVQYIYATNNAYSSSDKTKADIDENGIITAIYEGTAVITVSMKDYAGNVKTAEYEVTVVPPKYTVTFLGQPGENLWENRRYFMPGGQPQLLRQELTSNR